MTDMFAVLRAIGELEQAGGGPHGGVESKTVAPLFVFRFKSTPPGLAAALARWVEDFRGGVQWKFHSSTHGSNWVIGPQRLWDLAAERGLRGARDARWLLEQEDPDFGRRANADLELLSTYLASRWKQHATSEDGAA